MKSIDLIIRFFKANRYFFIIFLVSSLGTLSLLRPGFYESHDGIIHTMRLAHFSETLKQGIFPVRWLSTWGAGYGSPVFNYIWPLPYYLASLLHFLGMNYESSIEILLGISLIVSSLCGYLYLTQIVRDKFIAAMGAILYVWMPYRFIDIYIRGALGEALAFIFFPLTLYLSHRLMTKNLVIWGSMIWAGFILTHNMMALIGLVIFILYSLLLTLNVDNKSIFLMRVFISIFGGLLLSAFYWLPAMNEAYLVGLKNYLDGSFVMHAVSPAALISTAWRYAYAWPADLNSSMPFQLGNVQLIGWGLTLFVFLWRLFNKKGNRPQLFKWQFFTLMTCLFIILVTPVSLKLVRHFPMLGLINYPWRFLGPATFTLVIALTVGVDILSGRIGRIVAILMISTAVIFYWPYSKIVSYPYSATDGQYLEMIKTNTGFLPDNEFMPKTADYPNLIKQRGEAENHLLFESILQESLTTTGLIQDRSIISANLYSKIDHNIRFQQIYFPGWQVYIDGQVTKIQPDEYGLISFNLPAGAHQVLVKFTDTKVRHVANFISLISGFMLVLSQILIGIIWRGRQKLFSKVNIWHSHKL